VALFKSEGIRADILKGPVRKGDLHQVLPFDNKVMKAELTGKEIRTFIEFAVESNSLAQVSGLLVTYHGDRNRGERIEATFADGEPIADDRSYCLATIDYLFFEHGKSGGFNVLKKKHRSEVLSRDIVTRFITKEKRIAPSSECRVRRIPGATPSSQ
jgi:2',3'-cyclic-nucleotide 2'-phosphodiesterase (5'-nucleotidase family)